MTPYTQQVLELFTRSGLRKTQVAERTGLPYNTVNRFVNGIVTPDTSTLEKIATVCEAEINRLIEWHEAELIRLKGGNDEA